MTPLRELLFFALWIKLGSEQLNTQRNINYFCSIDLEASLRCKNKVVNRQQVILNKLITKICMYILPAEKMKLFLQGVQEGHPPQAIHFHLSSPKRQQFK